VATFTLEIDERTSLGKSIKKMILSIVNNKEVKLIEKPRYNPMTEKAIKEAKSGIGISKIKNHEDLMKKLRS
jgi:hypothetical protein